MYLLHNSIILFTFKYKLFKNPDQLNKYDNNMILFSLNINSLKIQVS